MANATYVVKVGWENNKDFESLYDDITNDVKSVHFSRGKSGELSKAEIGQCSITVKNSDNKYSPSYSSGSLYGNLLPKRPIKIYAEQQLITTDVTKSIAAASDYSVDDVMSESASAGTVWTFSNVTKIKGGTGYITKAQAICETTALTPHLTLYLFSAAPTCNLNDNAANTALLHADLANYIGKIDFPAMEDLGTGDSESIASSSTYGNLPLAFNCALNSTSIYGVLVTREAITGEIATMDIMLRLTTEVPNYPLFSGYIEEIIPHPDLIEQDCIITATDGLDFLSRHDMATALYKDTRTGVIHSYILDDAFWNQDMRILDTGQDIVPYWYGQDIKARFAQEEIDNNEQGFSYIDGAGNFVFEDRHHRSTAIHQISQGTFSDTMNQIKQSLNPRNIYNIIKVTVTPWTIQTEAELWRLKETPVIAPGDALTWWGEASVSGESVFVNEWVTPVITTDYTANSESGGGGDNETANVSITTTKFAKTIKLEITNNASHPIYMTLLKARGTWYDDQTRVTRKAEDSTSQVAYQKRTYELNGKYMTSADKAQDYCDYAIGKYKDPRAEISMTIMNQDSTILTQILTREISDRITVVNTELGINADYFIDYMEHDISDSGLLHTVTYYLSDCSNEDFWCLDYSAFPSADGVGTQTKLGY